MPLLSVDAMNASLDNDYGTTRGPNAADSHELMLLDESPEFDGVEITGGGYARPAVAPEDWDAADGGSKGVFVQFADATGAWSAPAKYWALVDAADHTTVWDYAALNEVLVVSEAGPGPGIQVTAFYADTAAVTE